jgi:hypothetical protein
MAKLFDITGVVLESVETASGYQNNSRGLFLMFVN